MEPLIFAAIITLVKILIVIGVMLGLVSYSVMAERRISAAIQDRIGPNRTGLPLGGVQILGFKIPEIRLWGLGQPIADALKFMLKEEFTPASVNVFYFWLAPAMAMVPSLLTICVIPFASLHDVVLPLSKLNHLFNTDIFSNVTVQKPGVIADLNVGILFVFAIASLSVYGIVLAGWSSNSKYPFLGGIRSSAQMISYEISMGLAVIPIFLIIGNLNLSSIVQYQIQHGWLALPVFASNLDFKSFLLWIPVSISFIIFLVAAFAETNRLPFDLPESETELVGGYHTEYSSMKFALFFLGEYAAMIVASCLMVTLFFGGWSFAFPFLPKFAVLDGSIGHWYYIPIQAIVFLIKMAFFIFLFIWVRWTLPRFRYDQLMRIGWKVFLPLALFNILLTGLILLVVERI